LVADYVLASTPEEAAELLAADPAAIVMGGGTTVVPRATHGKLNGQRVVGLARAGLSGIQEENGLRIGAMTPLREVATLERPAALAAAAREVGGATLRHQATVGGNVLCERPYGDLAPVLLALDAELELLGKGGAHRVPLAEALAADRPVPAGEILTAVIVPPAEGAVSFARCARLEANAPPIVTVAARVRREGENVAEARVAVSAVEPRAVRVSAAEEALTGTDGGQDAIAAAATAATEALNPVDDAAASAWYRARMTELYVRRALSEALEGGRG
jgi:CO/xanthine dehydrogenase FAD-binding subunit